MIRIFKIMRPKFKNQPPDPPTTLHRKTCSLIKSMFFTFS